MKELKDIRDDQIRIIGEGGSKKSLRRNVLIIILSILCIVAIGIILFFVFFNHKQWLSCLHSILCKNTDFLIFFQFCADNWCSK